MLTTWEALASIAVMAAVTFLTRALPFLLFDRGDHPPAIILYLGRVLPPVSFAAPAGWVPAAVSCVAVVLLHLWKNNDLISIFGGTVLYMALVQGAFG